MEFQIGDIVKLKKAHPCGTNEWDVQCLYIHRLPLYDLALQ